MLQDNGILYTNPCIPLATKVPDVRVFRKDREGATQIVDSFGSPCESRGYKIFPYLTMDVYVKEKENANENTNH